MNSQKFAVGNDLVFIPDFKQSLTPLFQNKVYTAAEIAYCDRFEDSLLRYASTWAAKEAVYKAIKQLDRATLSWKKIEITREKIGGRPHVIFHHNPANPFQVSLTLSHDGDYAWAIAIAELI
ncbi:holo-ACP synthase [Pedobacter sp. B4-66]|uniref:holo-ACP synthase n=1 Tax=Pedobacter sp. B4-66 TaxID=2817280 RepID=UPI001BDABDF2|nr:holo-ACP synthase [Pedobacter sp. B4-66]